MLFDLEKHLERGIPQDEAAAAYVARGGMPVVQGSN